MTSDNDTTQSETEQSGAFDFLPTSRRNVLAGSAGALGLFGAAGAGGLVGGEEHDDGNETSTDDQPEEETEDQAQENPWGDDVGILNYALTLERLEASFYEEALDTLSEEDLANYEPVSDMSEEHHQQIWEHLETVRDHEQTHVDAIMSTIEDLGGEVAGEPEFDFGGATEDFQTFVETAIKLEDTGVGAYAGAAPYVENRDIVTAALSIHSVEARHAAFVRALCKESPFPDAFDEALEREEVLDRASGFIVEAPQQMEDDVDVEQEPENATEGDNQTDTETEDQEDQQEDEETKEDEETQEDQQDDQVAAEGGDEETTDQEATDEQTEDEETTDEQTSCETDY